MTTTTLISQVIRDRMERGIADLLLSAYDAGYCAGAGVSCEQATHPGLRELLATIAMRHQAEVLALRGWVDPPLTADELPGWLLSLAQQADSVQSLATAERQEALGDARPPENWLRRTSQEGKP